MRSSKENWPAVFDFFFFKPSVSPTPMHTLAHTLTQTLSFTATSPSLTILMHSWAARVEKVEQSGRSLSCHAATSGVFLIKTLPDF